MKKWMWFAIGGVLLLLIIGVGASRGGKKAEPVQLARLRTEDITSRVRAPGKIEPRTMVKISADIPGKVIQLNIKEGDPVKRGNLLLQIDDTQYRTAHAQALAAQSSARARVREAESALRVNEAAYQRQKALFDQKLLSQAEWGSSRRPPGGSRCGTTPSRGGRAGRW